ncbi:Uncharacterised protein [Mycobacterium tuberculosis]|uniref:Uncharacterized protein n=1 Tax=Mycobacterium tuberculosis TaxID=1773 RepID=A0A655F990_MYCTX|nr:Uncharacterised protein [Mycobacterium tuberculosis]CKT23484.1 Uncharacterised protein [Mycobacterium tuberculosis]CNV54154.1 Uncharacterised protein [Mycobacterium tuberculosis]COV74144.1 Uncharacterised protein [Mycobacterium tuberculosis]COX14471.1 Uncharacterised protein [Mycobacterium tuberculosis]
MARTSASSGSADSVRCASFIAETPSIRAWCILVYIANRPSFSPSTTCSSHSGRWRSSRLVCSLEVSSSRSRTRPGEGSAERRTW